MVRSKLKRIAKQVKRFEKTYGFPQSQIKLNQLSYDLAAQMANEQNEFTRRALMDHITMLNRYRMLITVLSKIC